MNFKEAKILDVFIYPKEKELWDEFTIQFRLKNWEPEETAKLFPSNSHGLKIRVDVARYYDLGHLDLEKLGPKYNVELPCVTRK